jgi:hypothetical protein
MDRSSRTGAAVKVGSLDKSRCWNFQFFTASKGTLTAEQIDTLAQRLSETPIAPSTSAKKEGNNLAHLLVVPSAPHLPSPRS